MGEVGLENAGDIQDTPRADVHSGSYVAVKRVPPLHEQGLILRQASIEQCSTLESHLVLVFAHLPCNNALGSLPPSPG